MCYELVTGFPPFFDKDFDRMCDKILKKPIRFSSKYAISVEAQQLILGFLERNPANRLGSASAGGLAVLQDHVFYVGVDWDEAMNCRLPPPFIPLTGSAADDTRNFDHEFTKMSVKESPPLGSLVSRVDYGEFSYLDEEYAALRENSSHQGYRTEQDLGNSGDYSVGYDDKMGG